MAGDYSGKATCHSYNGYSTIDYGVASLELYKYILYFQVKKQTWYSDHMPLTIVFKQRDLTDWIDPHLHNQPEKAYKLQPIRSYFWDEGSKHLFKEYMSSPEITKIIKKQTNGNCPDSTDHTIEKLTNILHTAADKCCRKTCKYNNSMQTNKPKNCLPVELKTDFKIQKREFRKTLRAYNNNKDDINRRH